MTHKATTKKKKPPRAKKTPAVNVSSRDTLYQQDQRREEEGNEVQKKPLNSIMVTSGSISIEEGTSACNKAIGDLDKPAEILSNLIDNDRKSEDPEPSTSFTKTGCVQNLRSAMGLCRREKQQKRVLATTGMVSTVLGKDYVRASARPDSAAEAAARSVLVEEEAAARSVLVEEEAVKFLYSMLGGECELSIPVVRDVLRQFEYDVERASDALLNLSANSYEKSNNCTDNVNNRQDKGFADSLTDRASGCMSNSLQSKLQDSIRSVGYGCRNYSKVLSTSEAWLPSCPRSKVVDPVQELLDSFFNISKSSEQEPSTMNWRNVVKKIQSPWPGIDVCSFSAAEPQQDIHGRGDAYLEIRKTAKMLWDSVGFFRQQAATASSKGDWDSAASFYNQAKIHAKLAREADERASQDIFKVWNERFENVITFDLHGQHVKQAIRLLKLHLLLGTLLPSVQILRVITGYGKHAKGKSTLKESVIGLLKMEGIQWRQEDLGTVRVKVDRYREFSFLDSDSDSELINYVISIMGFSHYPLYKKD